MKRFSEQFKKPADRISMRSIERRELKDRLTAYMEYHPLPADLRTQKAVGKKASEQIESQPFTTISLNLVWVKNFVGAFALVLIVGVPVFAERTVPGDVLYPIKVQVNEEVRSSLSFSSYAKVEWETERLERRIAEARVLASEGKLTDEVQAEVAVAVQTHRDKATAEIAEIRDQDADEAAIAEIAFASALAVQTEVLAETAAKAVDNGASDAAVTTLAATVAVVNEEAHAAQAGSVASYEKLLARIESETTRAQEVFASVNKYASAEEKADVERRLQDVARKVAKAQESHSLITTETETESEDNEVVTETVTETATTTTTTASTTLSEIATTTEEVNEVEAKESVEEIDPVTLLREALGDIQKLISFMTDINVRETISVEELVPVTLTEEEVRAAIENNYNKALELNAELAMRVPAEDVFEKFTYGQEILNQQLETAKIALANNDYEKAEVAAKEALALGNDLYSMSVPTTVVEDVETSATTTETVIDNEATATTTIPSEDIGTTTTEVIE